MQILIMESLKVYGINIVALLTTSMTINETLQSIVLSLTIIYTSVNIINQFRNGKD